MSNTPIAARTFTFILAGGKGERLYPLTRDRAKPAIPIGASHRLIDFTISNCFNSGLREVHILTQHHHESLDQCLHGFRGPDRADNEREELVLSLCPPRSEPYRGTADAVFQNLFSVKQTNSDFVLILSGDHLYSMDYRDLIEFHIESGSEMTVAATEYRREAASQFGILETGSDSRLIGFEEKPAFPRPIPNRPSHSLVSMGVYVFNTPVLIDLLSRDAEQNSTHDFGRDIVPMRVGSSTSRVYNFADKGKKWGTYWRDVGTVDSFYRSNMDLLPHAAFKPLNRDSWPLNDRQRVRRSVPASQRDSLVAEGVFIESSAQVIQSVLSTGVRIQHRSHVEDSVLFANVRVGAGARIRRAILDENVQVPAGMEIGYNSIRDCEYGYLSEGGIVVISANTQLAIPHGRSARRIERTVVAEGDPLERRPAESSPTKVRKVGI